MKHKLDRIINAIVMLSAIAFLAGAMIAIWIGVIGLKIMASAAVTFGYGYILYLLTKERGEKNENRRADR